MLHVLYGLALGLVAGAIGHHFYTRRQMEKLHLITRCLIFSLEEAEKGDFSSEDMREILALLKEKLSADGLAWADYMEKLQERGRA